MAKLIHAPIECGYRQKGICLYNQELRDCTSIKENNFPEYCPLENGISTQKYIIKRSRKNCVHYTSKYAWTCEREENTLQKCSGVECGFYKSIKHEKSKTH